LRWEGCRFSGPPVITFEPSRWFWKKFTPADTRPPYSEDGASIWKVSEVAATAPAVTTWYVPAAVTDEKSIG
jgi:hypothetical protein